MTTSGISTNFSTRLLRKGALVEETYRVLAHWRPEDSAAANLHRIKETDIIGAKNQSWLREITTTLSSRFSHGDSVTALSVLAKAQYPMDRWKYCLLWHFGSTDGLFIRFVNEFLIPKRDEGIAAFDTQSVLPFVETVEKDGVLEAPLTSYGRTRLARDLLRMATAFGLLSSQLMRRFVQAPIPDDALLYALYSIQEQFSSVSRSLESPRWAVFLLSAPAVETELLHLHQLRRVRYEQAGSVRELSLPYDNLLDFTQSLIA